MNRNSWSPQWAQIKHAFHVPHRQNRQAPLRAQNIATLMRDAIVPITAPRRTSSGNIGQVVERSHRYANITLGGQQRAQQRTRQTQEEKAVQVMAEADLIWTSSETWRARDTNGTLQIYQIAEMEDEHLWSTITWAVANVIPLFLHYGNPLEAEQLLQLESKRWLRDCITFRRMVREAAKREFTFGATTYQYLTSYMLDNAGNMPIVSTTPWADPDKKNQQQKLKKLKSLPDKRPLSSEDVRRTFGKDARPIQL